MATNQEASNKTPFEQLVEDQQTTGDQIENIIRNVKKDSSSRKTTNYYRERLSRLDAAWAEFETTDIKIRCLEDPPKNHKYFTEKYYDNISDLTTKYRELFEKAMMEEVAANTTQASTADKHPTVKPNSGSTTSLSPTQAAIRRQSVMMDSLKRVLILDPTTTNMHLKEKLWEQIQSLHFSLWEISRDPLQDGYDMHAYTSLEKMVIENFKMSSTIGAEQGVHAESQSVLPLPKITLPKFEGDYLKWRSFFDLFSQLVDNQRLPTAQKMWYLKSNIAGEAEKLISHLSATAENYNTAWKLLQERYENKRVLVMTVIQQLLDQPSGGSSATAIKQLHDVTQECLHALQNLGIDTTTWGPMLLHLLVKKLDRGTHVLYERSLTNPKELPQVQQFLYFLETRFQSMEAMGYKDTSASKTCAYTSTPNRKINDCTFCQNGAHLLFECSNFRQLTPSERLNFVQKQRLCVNCLRSGHSSKNCRSRLCTTCNKKHNTLLHLEQSTISSGQTLPTMNDNKHNTNKISSVSTTPTNNTAENASSISFSPEESEATSLTTSNAQSHCSYVLLSTAMVKIKTRHAEIECRALLDSGSQVNFVTERMARRIGISLQPSSVNINGIGTTNTKAQHRINVELHSLINGFSTSLEAFVLPRIISPQPSQFINIDEWALPKNLVLADPKFNRPDKIDILLGAEHYHQLLSIGQIKLSKQLPTLQNTVFGWIVAGKIQEEYSPNAACGVCSADESLELSIARLWELEDIKGNNKPLSIAEKECEEHFSRYTRKNHDNRFIVKLPFHQSPDALGDSHKIALNRFLSIERRLQRDIKIRDEYTKFMREYETLGHMTKIAPDAISSPNYFIPHHCILRPESSTTKLRVVFDASSKTSSGNSLNDLMYTGPTVQDELFSILLRFRMKRFVFTTDVEKMYRQILISPEDRQYQLIIWREDSSKPITYYQLNTITYGTRAAPYLATKCLQTLATENRMRYPLASQFLKNNFYVDDGLGGADNLTTAMKLQEELIQLMEKYGFNLRKWCANHPQLLRNISQGDLEVNLDFESAKADSIKTLGLTWLPKEDKFCIKVNVDPIKRITKRSVTSDLARLFDPLGLISPIIVTAKIFIQNLWELKLDWDQSLPEELHTKWLTFRSDLSALKTLQISRHIFKGEIPVDIQLHIFTDASEKAYGAAAYVRSVFKTGIIITRLLCGKSRVAPLKRQTIPRLELCAAVLGSQLATKVMKAIDFTGPVWFWTDSEIVLSWLHSPSASYNNFVANRISAIQETTQAKQWRHVSTKLNPADILSRGLSPRALQECTLWFCGPLFLHGRETSWPPEFNPSLTISNDLERKRKSPGSLIVTAAELDCIYGINHGNSFRQLQRTVAYVLRFIAHTRCKSDDRASKLHLTTAELDQALIPIIKGIQASDFKEEIKQLKKYNELQGLNTINNLSPFLDENGIIRVGGRLDSSSLAYDSKHQMLLPYNDPISKLIFEMVHKDNKHCGAQTLLGIVRQRYWPIKGKIMARATIHRCTRCSRARPALFNQIMGNLPATRVTPARPFITSGVDYCGPITVHYKLRGKRPHKAYIAVFCCFATKAVHLELVSDLTTEAFIGALKRFIGRRGHCQTLFCDNATNFVGAKNSLPELRTIIHSSEGQEAITNACNEKGIQFNFIPPRAPHFGGLWEAAVKSAKHLLVRSLGNASLTYEELETLVIEIEAILNSRPISPMSNDPNDIAALTPGHFLIGEPLTAQIDAHAKTTKIGIETRWKLVSQLKHEFWIRWSRDYLNELQYRNKWQEQSKNVKEGDIVILKESNVPVMHWPIGRVISTYKGRDNIVRVADVKTASGTFKRAVQYLAPLPTLNDEGEKDSHNQSNLPKQTTTNIEPQPVSPSPNETIAKKRRRISVLPSMPLLIMALMSLPLIMAGRVEITEFAPKIGLHFEGIGNSRISRSEWNILTYYKLQPYWQEMDAFVNGTSALRHLCNLINQKATCANTLQTFEGSLADLTNENTLLKRKRSKRGAVNAIGNIANTLFGVLDSNYAEQMSNTIHTLNKDGNTLRELLRNQTSIIDATLNVFKEDESKVKEKFENLDSQLTEIAARIREDDRAIHQAKLFQLFASLAIQLSMISSRLNQIQTIIIAALSDSHHGKISPKLLTPSQLQTELIRVRNHLSPSLQLPVDPDNLLQLYKIMNVKGGITNDHVIFHITLPLCDPDTFKVFKAHPIPLSINNTLIAIQPCSDLIAINAHRDQYFLLTERQWRSCLVVKEDEFLCPNIQSKFNADADKCLCEISLLNNSTQTNCAIVPFRENTSITKLEHNNHWLYSMQSPTRINAVCGQEHSQITLRGSGLLKISPDCTLKHKSIIIQGHETYSSSLHASYTATTNVSTGVYPVETQFTLAKFQLKNYTDHLQNITNIQQQLHQQVLTELPSQIQHIKYHYASIAYAALLLTIGVIITMSYKRTQCRRFQVQGPRPAARQHIPPADYVVTET